MRRELEILAQIDYFLDGKITKEELLQSTEYINDLDGQIESQRYLRKAIQKEAFIQQSQNSLSKFKLLKVVKFLSLTVLGIATIAVVIFLFGEQKPKDKTSAVNATESTIQRLRATADSLITSQIFKLNNLRDTVVITKAGIILSISKNSFETENSEHYKIEVKEAITPVEIIKAGLSTMAGATVLETGGMFKVSAYQAEKELALKQDKFIDFLVPTSNKIPGMKLYTGVIIEGGEINWVKPKKLDNFLTSVDINSLNFYPAKYQKHIAKKQWWKNGKSWTDSMYYDLSKITTNDKLIVGKDTTFQYRIAAVIEPKLIQAFWNNSFNNTLLATLEFEKRLPLIHKSGDNNILNLYTSNLNKNLYEIDSMAMQIAGSQLKESFRYLMQLRERKVDSTKSVYELYLLNKAIKESQKKRKNLNENSKLSYYRGRLVKENLEVWCNIDVPFAKRKAILVDEAARYERLIKNLKNNKNNSAVITHTELQFARKNIQINIKNFAQFKSKHCFAYLLRKDANSFEKIPLRQNQLVIKHKNIDNYELAIVGVDKDRNWLCVPDKIEDGLIELNLETSESFESKIEAIASSDRFKQNMFSEVKRYSNVTNENPHGVLSRRMVLAKSIYSVAKDTILNRDDINSYKMNSFTIQTIDFKSSRRKAPSVPTKLSKEINQLKVFLNTTVYKINLKTKGRFRVEVYNEDGQSVLGKLFNEYGRQTDYDSKQQNMAIIWSIKKNKKIKKGTYIAKIYYVNKMISSNIFKVF